MIQNTIYRAFKNEFKILGTLPNQHRYIFYSCLPTEKETYTSIVPVLYSTFPRDSLALSIDETRFPCFREIPPGPGRTRAAAAFSPIEFHRKPADHEQTFRNVESVYLWPPSLVTRSSSPPSFLLHRVLRNPFLFPSRCRGTA